MKDFEIGEVVRALRTIHFMDGKIHHKGFEYVITKDTKAYFDINNQDYELLDEDIYVGDNL